MHHLTAARYNTRHGVVCFTVPTDSELEHVAAHLTTFHNNDDSDVSHDVEGDEFCIDIDSDALVHRVWWIPTGSCTSVDDCCCGRVGLVDVMDFVDDPGTRNEMLTIHLTEMVAAYNHYWAGDAAVRDPSHLLEALCADCVIHGERHIAQVGGEAAALAEELGEALAVYQFHMGVGQRRFPIAHTQRPDLDQPF